jgi:hypothetical protein
VGGIINTRLSVCGAVAQLGARLTGSQKVRGSNPLGSTTVHYLLKSPTLGSTTSEPRGALRWEESWRTLYLHGH